MHRGRFFKSAILHSLCTNQNFFVRSVTKPIATEESISLKTPTFHNGHTRVTSLPAQQDKKAHADLTSSINPTSPHRHKHNLSTQPHVPIVEVEIHSSFFSTAFVSRAFRHIQWLKIRMDNIVFWPVTMAPCLQLILCNDILTGNTLKKIHQRLEKGFKRNFIAVGSNSHTELVTVKMDFHLRNNVIHYNTDFQVPYATANILGAQVERITGVYLNIFYLTISVE